MHTKLPFEDNQFDLVTWPNEIYIHVPKPQQALEDETGIKTVLLCVEPNNIIQSLTKTSLTRRSIDETLDHIKPRLIIERQKKNPRDEVIIL
jgi:ubiquinone/menaquinone biosynthesis C-methylase UbiE